MKSDIAERLGRIGPAGLWLALILTAAAKVIWAASPAIDPQRPIVDADLRVRVEIAESANDDSPVAVDIVLVYDRFLSERLLTMPARQWFATRDQIMRDYLLEAGVACWSWEWVPGQRVGDIELAVRSGARTAFVFAGYHTEGAHRVRFDPLTDIALRIDKTDFVVRALSAVCRTVAEANRTGETP